MDKEIILIKKEAWMLLDKKEFILTKKEMLSMIENDDK